MKRPGLSILTRVAAATTLAAMLLPVTVAAQSAEPVTVSNLELPILNTYTEVFAAASQITWTDLYNTTLRPGGQDSYTKVTLAVFRAAGDPFFQFEAGLVKWKEEGDSTTHRGFYVQCLGCSSQSSAAADDYLSIIEYDFEDNEEYQAQLGNDLNWGSLDSGCSHWDAAFFDSEWANVHFENDQFVQCDEESERFVDGIGIGAATKNTSQGKQSIGHAEHHDARFAWRTALGAHRIDLLSGATAYEPNPGYWIIDCSANDDAHVGNEDMSGLDGADEQCY